MAENILSELLELVKQQIQLQEKLSYKLLKTDFICHHAEVGMVILFGGYAREEWIDEYEYENGGIHFKYQSDFNLLVIVYGTCNLLQQKKLEQSIFKEIYNSSKLCTPASIFVYDINFINYQLKKAQYFFSDIKKDGLTLYDAGKFKLEEATELINKERHRLAKEDFDYWLSSAKEFAINYKNAFDRKSYSIAAFELHQVTERLYTCILLVFTRYKPTTHKLETLRKLTNTLDKRLIKVFPLITQEEIHLFTMLCEAYVDARYKRSYTITKNDLSWLAGKVQELMRLTKILCKEKIKSFLAKK